jgi:hypothetical protein
LVIIHGTKKFLDRVGRPTVEPDAASTTALGSWFATVMFWRPQAALFVNVQTLLPVFLPLAPGTLRLLVLARATGCIWGEFVVDERAVDLVCAEHLVETHAEPLRHRRRLGSMNDFIYMAEAGRERGRDDDLLTLSVRLAHTPCGPLRDRTGWPDLELRALVKAFAAGSEM